MAAVLGNRLEDIVGQMSTKQLTASNISKQDEGQIVHLVIQDHPPIPGEMVTAVCGYSFYWKSVEGKNDQRCVVCVGLQP